MSQASHRIHVLAAILLRADAHVLLAQRPKGRAHAGWWEFPGGKREAGESRSDALARELDEEIGVVPQRARALLRFEHAYASGTVDLDFWLVEQWRGDPQAREAQALLWQPVVELDRIALLPANLPVATLLRRLVAPRPCAGSASGTPAVGA